ncbi:MAG: helix-turn-helix transcriptional regulator [Clostridia bacterium]|nr:helix-turn-helix transcriptional regulator [Clostridia bacterium]MBQ9132832.1 helix-turn-helix transcriptional regulator [Clostridia bacterium]
MKVLSQRLIALRKERELTQADLAKAINKTRSTVSGYETEGKEPDYATLCNLARFFSVSTDYLLGVEDSKNHSDVVFVNRSIDFQKKYEALPSGLRHKVAKIYDRLYLLLNSDMVNRSETRLDLYVELFSVLQAFRDQIKSTVEKSGGQANDPLMLSNLMALQGTFKTDVSTLLDKLLQADIHTAFDAQNNADGPAEK